MLVLQSFTFRERSCKFQLFGTSGSSPCLQPYRSFCTCFEAIADACVQLHCLLKHQDLQFPRVEVVRSRRSAIPGKWHTLCFSQLINCLLETLKLSQPTATCLHRNCSQRTFCCVYAYFLGNSLVRTRDLDIDPLCIEKKRRNKRRIPLNICTTTKTYTVHRCTTYIVTQFDSYRSFQATVRRVQQAKIATPSSRMPGLRYPGPTITAPCANYSFLQDAQTSNGKDLAWDRPVGRNFELLSAVEAMPKACGWVLRKKK